MCGRDKGEGGGPYENDDKKGLISGIGIFSRVWHNARQGGVNLSRFPEC